MPTHPVSLRNARPIKISTKIQHKTTEKSTRKRGKKSAKNSETIHSIDSSIKAKNQLVKR